MSDDVKQTAEDVQERQKKLWAAFKAKEQDPQSQLAYATMVCAMQQVAIAEHVKALRVSLEELSREVWRQNATD